MHLAIIFFIIAILVGAVVFWLVKRFIPASRLLAVSSSLVVSVLVFLFLQGFVSIELQIKSYDRNLRKKHPVFSLIAKHNAAEYQTFLDEIRSSFQFSLTKEQMVESSFALMSKIYPQYVASASDQDIYEDLLATLSLYKKMYQDYPVLILKIEFPQRFLSIDLQRLQNPYYEKELLKMQETRSRLIATAITQPQSAPKEAVINASVDRILQALIEKFGETAVIATFTGNEDMTLDKRQAAEIVIQFYQLLLAQMPAGAGPIMRYFSQAMMDDDEVLQSD